MKTGFSSEGELLEGARRFEREALAAIYDRYSPGLYAYSLRLLGDPDLAEECTAETFSRFLHTLSQGNSPRQYLQAYLYRIAHNWINDWYRRQPPAPLSLEDNLHANDAESPQQVTLEHLAQRRVRNALLELTPDQRQVIVLKYLEGWELEEIAAALNKSVGAVKALQHRALEALRAVLIGVEEA
jgi:RNA polymerase sigma-70 factor (ECF subfamily)